MSKLIERVEIIIPCERRRRYIAKEKVRLVEETMQPGMTVSAVVRLHGISRSLVFGWRRSGPTRTWWPPAVLGVTTVSRPGRGQMRIGTRTVM